MPAENHHAILKIRDSPGRDHLPDCEPMPSAAEGVREDHSLDKARLVLQGHELHGQIILSEDEFLSYDQRPEPALVTDALWDLGYSMGVILSGALAIHNGQ